MVDYYQIMGLKPDANSTAIRSAYKRLAMLYHPDRNPNNPEAEELFKVINEAYQVLSDPIKKQQYDLRYHGIDTNLNHSSAHDKRAYWREYHHKQYEHWRQNQQPSYQFDKRYFKIQGLAIATFLTIAGICFLFINIFQYFQEQKLEEQTRLNRIAINEVHSLFNQGKKKEAFTLIRNLQKQQPHEYSFYFTEDTLLINLHAESEKLMEQAKFDLAIQHLLVLKDYEEPVSINTLQNLATCDIHIGNYSSALINLKILFEQQPDRVSLLLAIATIYQDKLSNYAEAEKYLTLGKKLFKLRMTEQYGEAFQLVADPNDISQVYYEIFLRRLQVNLKLNRFEEAEKDGNWAIYLRPKQAEIYYWRAQALQKNSNKKQACADLKQAIDLGFSPAKEMVPTFCR